MYVEFDVRDRILIVGSGASGLSCATELRRLGFAGEIVVMGDEPEGHYDRPACSKGILSGQKRPSDIITPLDPDLDVIWRLGRRAVSCDLERRVVEAHTGESIYFDGLVVATGARAVVPNDWPDDQPGMHVISGLQAAWNLRRDLRNVKRVAVVGGGVTGCEVACAVKDMARQAVIIEPRPFVMGRAVGSVVGHMVAASHKRSGIEIASGGRVMSLDYSRDKWHLTLKDGSTVTSDIVVGTMGERPDLSWLDGTGIDTSDGVLCDESLRVLNTAGHAVDGVVACGSIARWPNPRGNGKPQKVGQWIAAQEQGIGAARALMAGGRPVPAVSILPRFWTHQGGLRIEVCGEVDPKADIEVHELRPGKKDPAKAGVMATYTRNGKLIGSVAVNAPRLFTNTARMMRLDEPSVTVLPPLPAPVSPGVGPLEAPPVRLALGAAPEPAPTSSARALPALPSSASSDPREYGYAGAEAAYAQAGYAQAGYGPGGYAQAGYAPAGYDPAYDRAGYEATYDRAGYDPMYDRTVYDRTVYDAGYGRADFEQGYGPAPYDPGYDERYADARPDATYVRGIDDTGNFPVPAGLYDQPSSGALVQEYQYGKTRGFGTPPRLANGPAAGSGYGPTSGPGFGADAYSGPAYGTPGYGSRSGHQRALPAGPSAHDRPAPSESYDDSGYGRGYNSGYGPTRDPAHEHSGHGQSAYGSSAYEPGGYGQRGHDRAGYGQGGYEPGGYGQGGYEPNGHGQGGYGPNGHGQSAYEPSGYDHAGHTQGGYGPSGYEPDGYDRAGSGHRGPGQNDHDRNGYEQDGYGPSAYQTHGYHRAGHTQGGYGPSGYEPSGYDRAGHVQSGYDRAGYGQSGYDRAGYGQSGYGQAASFGQSGYGPGSDAQARYDQARYDQSGHARSGYDQPDHAQARYDQSGHARSGYDQPDHARSGYDQSGYDRSGYDRSGYDRSGYGQSGYDRGGNGQGVYEQGGQSQDGYDRSGHGRHGHGPADQDRDGYGPEPAFGPPQHERYWQPRLAHVG